MMQRVGLRDVRMSASFGVLRLDNVICLLQELVTRFERGGLRHRFYKREVVC